MENFKVLVPKQVSDEQERYYQEGVSFIPVIHRANYLYYCRHLEAKNLDKDIRDVIDGFYQNLN